MRHDSPLRTTVPAGLLITALAGAALVAGPARAAGGDGSDRGLENLPDTITLTGVVRDFRERTDPEGHPDFEQRPARGFGQYCGNVAEDLGADRRPVFTGEGWRLRRQWTDSAGRPICHVLFDASRGDQPGEQGDPDPGAIHSAESFASWFDTVPGVNMSKAVDLRLVRQDDGRYVFDDKDDPAYAALDGFFPIEDQLFGNPGGSPDRNFHFTFELHTQFEYDEEMPQIFHFIGDDDVWVFINDKLVIDLGGVHAATEQYVDVSRLGLEHGETYALDFFFAERHRTQSNFRVETTLMLQSVKIPSVTAAFD